MPHNNHPGGRVSLLSFEMDDNRTESDARDARVMQLYEELLEIEQRLIPTGLHVLGRPSLDSEKTDLLRMVASFDRPEFDARSLPDVVAETMGLSKQHAKENIDRVVTTAIRKLIEGGIDAASDFLLR